MIPPSNGRCDDVPPLERAERTLRDLMAQAAQLDRRNRELEKEVAELRAARDRLDNPAALLRIAGKIARLGGWAITLPERTLTWSEETCLIHDAPPGYQPTLREGIELFPPEHRAEIEGLVQRCLETGMPYEFEGPKITLSGRRIWVRSMGEAVRDAQGTIIGLQGAFQDITEQRATAQAHAENLRRFHEMAECIGEGFFNYDLVSNRLIYANSAFGKIRGQSTTDTCAHPSACSDAVHPEHRAAVKEAFERQLAGEETELEYRIARPDGDFRWVHEHVVPILDEHGQVERIVGTIRDITDRKGFEQQFLRAQRMESIGTLAGGIAHDLNNALVPILISIDLFKLAETDPERLKLIAHIERGANHSAALVKQVLTFARGVEGHHMPVNLRDLTRDIDGIVRDTFPKNINLRITASADLWHVTADATQLHQVLINLCVNARDSMPQGGLLTIDMRNLVLDKARARLKPGATPGDYVAIEVKDTGLGISDDIRERVFDPFFTTKESGKGTGLGLATVMMIVKSHRGFIDLQSDPGRGARFTLLLPATPARSANLPIPSVEPLSPPTEKSVALLLVVDDEESIRFTAKAALEHYGYRVLLAENGQEALKHYAQHQSEIAAVITDMAMPIMDGPQTMRELRRMNPAIKLIASSGHTNPDSLVTSIGFAPDQFLAKPYSVTTLLKTIAQVLHPEPPDKS